MSGTVAVCRHPRDICGPAGEVPDFRCAMGNSDISGNPGAAPGRAPNREPGAASVTAASARRCIAALLAVGLLGGASPAPAKAPVADVLADKTELRIAMSMREVARRWGKTGCLFRDIFQEQPVEAWGYGLHTDTGAVVGLADCERVSVVLYFSRGKLIGWAEAEP